MTESHSSRTYAVALRRYAPVWLRRVQRQWQGRIAWYVFTASGVALLGVGLFAALGEEVFEHGTGSLDGAVRAWMLAHQSQRLVVVFTWITRAGGTLPLLGATAVLCVWLWRGRARHAAAGALAAPVLSVGLFSGLKVLFARARPEGALRFGIHSYAFPSGHSTVSMAAAVTFAYVLWRERLLPGFWAISLGVAFPLLVGISRAYLDVHWATDVLGGWSVGLFVAGVAGAAYERLRRDPVVAGVEGRH